MDALIGHSGFVGGTLRRQRGFDVMYRSTDIEAMAGRRFDTVVCAGISATKWQANRDPAADRAAIDQLWAVLDRVDCARFVLISTADVFAAPDGVDEADVPDATQPYGRHRHEAELRARERFSGTAVVRLPGLVGPGLRKNALFDLAHRNRLEHLDPRAVFQFYPMVNFWHDLGVALEGGLDTVHLTAVPLELGAVARDAFAIELDVPEALVDAPAQRYDLRSRHAARFGGIDGHTYTARESMLAIRAYAQAVANASEAAG